jgi:hypothetical protein
MTRRASDYSKGRSPSWAPAVLLARRSYGAGQVSGAGGVSIGTRGRWASAVSLSPAISLCAHWPAGMNSWMNAKAGAAVRLSIRSDAAATATSVLLSLIKVVSSLTDPRPRCLSAGNDLSDHGPPGSIPESRPGFELFPFQNSLCPAHARILRLLLSLGPARIAPSDRVLGAHLAIAALDHQLPAAGREEILSRRNHRTSVGTMRAPGLRTAKQRRVARWGLDERNFPT